MKHALLCMLICLVLHTSPMTLTFDSLLLARWALTWRGMMLILQVHFRLSMSSKHHQLHVNLVLKTAGSKVSNMHNFVPAPDQHAL
jgi:hypothetical protein